MRIDAYDVRPDELVYFEQSRRELGADIVVHDGPLTMEVVDECRGATGVSVLGVSRVTAEVSAALAERGVRFVATRSIGYDNVDVAAANAAGVRVSHVEYPPEAVAEYTVMLLLMTARKMRTVLHRAEMQDYSLQGSVGRQLSQMTVGIVGAGRIGGAVARRLKPFGCRILAYDTYENPDLAGVVEFVPLETVLRESDAITLHAPALPQNHHMIDTDQFAMMRDGVMLVNCGRGDLIHTAALIEAIESGKVSGVALDVIENDLQYFHHDHRMGVIRNRNLAVLRSFPNVTLTPHIAFYTESVMADMVGGAMKALVDFAEQGSTPLEVTP